MPNVEANGIATSVQNPNVELVVGPDAVLVLLVLGDVDAALALNIAVLQSRAAIEKPVKAAKAKAVENCMLVNFFNGLGRL